MIARSLGRKYEKIAFYACYRFFLNPTNVMAEQSLYGIYSNLYSSSGEPSGYEMFFLHDGRPGRCSDSVLFQIAEGWPQYPELLDCCACSLNRIEFVSKKVVKFIGKIENDTLIGEFIEMKQKVRLKKRPEFLAKTITPRQYSWGSECEKDKVFEQNSKAGNP